MTDNMKSTAFFYKMPNCKTCKEVEPLVERVCNEQGIVLVDVSLQDVREEALKDLALHGCLLYDVTRSRCIKTSLKRTLRLSLASNYGEDRENSGIS